MQEAVQVVAGLFFIHRKIQNAAVPGELAVLIAVWRKQHRDAVHAGIGLKDFHVFRLPQETEVLLGIAERDQVAADLRQERCLVASRFQPDGSLALVIAQKGVGAVIHRSKKLLSPAAAAP